MESKTEAEGPTSVHNSKQLWQFKTLLFPSVLLSPLPEVAATIAGREEGLDQMCARSPPAALHIPVLVQTSTALKLTDRAVNYNC